MTTANSSSNLGAGLANLVLDPGENITVTYTHTQIRT